MKTVEELAIEAGMDVEPPDHICREKYWSATNEELERFRDLVRAEALEEAAMVCEGWKGVDSTFCVDAIRALKDKK